MAEPRYFFLRGFMKSGTNWAGKLLNSHPEISCIGEYHWERILAPTLRSLLTQPLFTQRDNFLAKRTHENMETMVRTTMRQAADPQATVIGGRTPHTLVPVVLRGAPHIVMLRDGRDVLVSHAFHVFNKPEFSKFFFDKTDMRERLEAFRQDPWFFQKHPEQLLASKRLVRTTARWWKQHLSSDQATLKQLPNLPVLVIRYEQLHADVESYRRKMFEFLGVDPELAEPVAGELQPGFAKERPDQFFRKGAVGDWENYFTDDSRAWFNEIAGQTLLDHGYVESLDW